jgi:hypothetical protein
MTESSEQRAPELGTPTDSPVGDEARAALNGDEDQPGSSVDELARTEQTMETPDELGGTGGKQAGGAG